MSGLTNLEALIAARGNDSVSGGDARTNRYMAFLGPDAGRAVVGAYDKTSYQNYDMPEYYQNKSLYLRDTVTGFITAEDIDWPTTVCLPWFATDQIKIAWNEWHFNTVLAGRVPHEGVPRLVTSSKKEFADRTVRRGLAFVMEADFLDTPDGAVHFQRNLRGIVQCVQVTQNYDTIYTLLNANKFDRAAQPDRRLDISITQLLEKQRDDYAALCYAEDQISVIVAYNRKLLQRRGADADLLILAAGCGMYITQPNPTEAEFWNFDANGELVRRNGPRTLTTLPNGTRVFETREYDVDDDQPAIDLLRRPQTVGEYYTVLASDINSASDFRQYRSAWRAIHIYDEPRDDFTKINFVDMLRASNVYNVATGELAPEVTALAAADGEEGGEDGGADDVASRAGSKRARRSVNRTRRSAFMMLGTTGADGRRAPVKYFGEFDDDVISDEDFVRAATSVAGKVELASMADAVSEHTALLELQRNLDAAPYSAAFFEALAAANVDRGTEVAPVDGVAQWRRNQYGSLDLPRRDEAIVDDGVDYPPAYGNLPGLRTLAAQVQRNQGWRDVGVKAAAAVRYVERIVSAAKNVAPRSEALNSANALPWFINADAATVFYETAIGVSREPLFLRRAGGAGGLAAAAPLPSKQRATAAAKGPLAVVPLFAYGANDAQAVREAVAASGAQFYGLETAAEVPKGGARVAYAFLDPAGQVHVAPRTLVADARVTPGFLVAEHLMGENSHAAFRAVLGRIAAQTATPAGPRVRALVGAVLARAGDVQQARRAVLALSTIDSENDLAEALDGLAPLAPGSAAGAKAVKAAGRRFDELAAQFADEEDGARHSAFGNAPHLEAKLVNAGEQLPVDLASRVTTILTLARTAAGIARREEGALAYQFGERVRAARGTRLTEEEEQQLEELNEQIDEALTNLIAEAAAQGMDLSRLRSDFEEQQQAEEQPRGAAPQQGARRARQPAAGGVWVRAPLSMTRAVFESLPAGGGSYVAPSVDGDWTRADAGAAAVDVEGRAFSALYEPSADHISAPRSLHATPWALRLRSSGARATLAPSAAAMDMDDDDDDGYGYSAAGASSSTAFLDAGARNWGRPRRRVAGAARGSALSERFALRFRRLSEYISDPVVRAAALALALLPNNLLVIERLVNNDVYVPFNVLLLRPLIEHDMSSGILMQSGLSTGGNMYGDSNMAFGADAVSKLVFGNFTFYSKAMVWKPRHIIVLENIKPEAYLGGNDTRWIMSKADLRLEGRARPSLISVLLPAQENELPNPLSITGSLDHLVPDLNQNIDNGPDARNHYSSSSFIERLYGFGKLAGDEQDLVGDYFKERFALNYICWHGAQFGWNVTENRYNKFQPNTGHWKEQGVGRGAAGVRNGRTKFFPKQNWGDYHLT